MLEKINPVVSFYGLNINENGYLKKECPVSVLEIPFHLEVNSSLHGNKLEKTYNSSSKAYIDYTIVINGFYDFTKKELEIIEKVKTLQKIGFNQSLKVTTIEFKKAV